MMARILTLCLLLCSLVTTGQTTKKPVSSLITLESSPQAQQYQKYGDIPVDIATGIPSINIPFGSIGLKGLDWPLSLNYHSGGIKVSEIASNVGLGWVFSGLGMISAQVLAQPDTHFPLTDTTITKRFLNFSASAPATGMPCNYASATDISIAESFITPTLATNPLPDIYYLNLGSTSLKMFIKGDSCYTIPSSDYKIKIDRTYSGSLVWTVKFRVTDNTGNMYYLSPHGRNEQNSFCAGSKHNSHDVNFVYYVDSILTPFNEKMSFYYSTDSYSYSNPRTFTLPQPLPYDIEPCVELSIPPPSFCDASFNTQEAKLDSIVSSRGDRVLFSYASRNDAPGGKRMIRVSFYAKTNLISLFDLEQDYIESAYPTPTDPNFLRLRLKSVSKKNTSLSKSDVYKFSYNPEILPDRFSYSVDSMGYYNGKVNTTLVTKFSDRSFSEGHTKAGILETIQYPTGGTSSFEYELNTHGYGGLRVKRIVNTDSLGIPSIRKFNYPFAGKHEYSFEDMPSTYFSHAIYDGEGAFYTIYQCSYWIYSSEPYRLLSETYQGIKPAYPEVEELLGDNGENGKTYYNYGYMPSYPNSYSVPDLVLFEKRVYQKESNAYTLKVREKYKYDNFIDSSIMYNIFANPSNTREARVWGKEVTKSREEQSLPEASAFTTCHPKQMGESVVLLVSHPNLLKEKTVTTFEGADSIMITEKYNYDVTSHLNPTRSESSNSRGEVIYTKSKYAPDYGTLTGLDNWTQGVAGLKQKNISSAPVEQSSYIIKGPNEFLLSATLNSYKASMPVIDTILSVNLDAPLASNQFAGLQNLSGTLVRDARYKPEYIFPLFDNKGNVLMQRKADDVIETILWGYDSRYPIARIIGSDYTTVSSLVDLNILNAPASDLQLRTEIQKIRTNFANTNVQVMGNTYLYGVGISSETDARGITSFYEYDSFNRLKLIRRHDGNILKMFDYKVKSSD